MAKLSLKERPRSISGASRSYNAGAVINVEGILRNITKDLLISS
jgi:hypothetical protein